ncbi:MAG: LytR C-terminal domain-containing protein [Actinomycetota bacterium]|nr:LytR C-terminal domain-containing protein [Actinomycetota bacterium]
MVLADLVSAGTRAITLDGDLPTGDLAALGNAFRQFNPDDLRTYALPVFDAVAGGAQVLRLDAPRAQPILDVFRGEDPGRVAPDNTVVQVQNGTLTSGLGGQAAHGLRALGFVVPPEATGDAESFDIATTTVYHRAGNEAQAALLASALAVDPVVAEIDFVIGADVSLVIGADWPGVAPELRPPTPGLVTVGTGTTETTATTTPAAGGSGSTTTTEVVGEVPDSVASATC